ncbi:MAG: GntR family transcriptional regulator [Clostridia bacterium]|nr:GntR family transcriptional regulator [Clostridia bacterium]
MNIILSNNSDVPIYQQIVDQIREAVIKGELMQGTLMPSIRNLAKDLKISVITTKRAYDELEHEGLLVTMAGKGTFVAPSNIEMLREARLKEIEQHLEKATVLAKSIGLEKSSLEEMLKVIFEEVDV